ncbi:MAG: chromosome segregation protein SMC [Sporichthyaceae bacterium]|nr:chromosome segregation protein SMC [Sporichthyaceae bacterium]
MHLKSVTLRGFKSFASATTLRFEPGITCVVGPNGSGKSNVVDALAWVMGEQGAKSLRGGKMEDVIFAGTAGRPPLGRAEVVLTIDNSDGALPIEYSEVTISRTMFRSGGSEYAINGNHCRLLDIQELLSDSGIGREMHVIVGQGQLDSVLSATPEDRRGFIEEAAGVLKHRKRKEKALRKLDAMQANLTRLQDLTAELRRQLKPLGKQAEVARKAAVIQADLRDAKLRLLADDLVQLRGQLQAEVADETALRDRRRLVETELTTGKAREQELEVGLAEAGPAFARAQEAWYRLSGLRERFRGTAGLAAERSRHLVAETSAEERRGRDPEEMETEAARIKGEEAQLAEQTEHERAALAEAVTRRTETEQAFAAEERRLTTTLRALADRREGLARLTGQVTTLEAKLAAADAEIGRLTAAQADAQARAEQYQEELAALETQVAGLDASGEGLDAEHETATAVLAAVEQRLAGLHEQERDAERERAALVARKDALELGLAHKDGAGALLASTDRVPGLLGSVAALVTVEAGASTAIAAALGMAADAVAVADLNAAMTALRRLKSDEAGRASVLVGSEAGSGTPGSVLVPDRAGWPALPDGCRYAIDLIQAPPALHPALRRLLDRVVVVADLDRAAALLGSVTGVTAVTRDGDLLGGDLAVGGSSSAPSLIEVQAAVDDAAQRLAEASRRCERLQTEIEAATAEAERAATRVEQASALRGESDSRRSGLGRQVAQLGATARSAQAESERLATAIAAAQGTVDADTAGLAELRARLSTAEQTPADEEPGPEYRDRLAAACTATRQTEMECRLAVRTSEERIRALAGRSEQLVRAAAQERAARERAAARQASRVREARVAAAVATGAEYALGLIDESLRAAARERDLADRTRGALEAELHVLRGRIRELDGELDQLTDTVHKDEMARAEQRMRIEALEQKALEEHGIDVTSLIGEYGPDQPIPLLPDPDAPTEDETGAPILPKTRAYVRAEQERRLATAERGYALLGRVNPLALEEYAALEERLKFLTEQLEDLKATRRDLLTVIKEVDERVEQVFAAAFEDTAREFEQVFARLFPGGEGRLVLTDPHDMLTTGIEVEARPPGKKIKRLSLLSGGERSLTAVALLVAIFKARPSPFYVLDEVEAALDDTNLGRLLGIYQELRESSQLIVITHQKRTMEIADALYGTSMRGDGVTAVISQRLRDDDSVAAGSANGSNGGPNGGPHGGPTRAPVPALSGPTVPGPTVPGPTIPAPAGPADRART